MQEFRKTWQVKGRIKENRGNVRIMHFYSYKLKLHIQTHVELPKNPIITEGWYTWKVCLAETGPCTLNLRKSGSKLKLNPLRGLNLH